MSNSAPPQRDTRGRLLPGHGLVSHGRPRTGLALAECIRRRIDPELVLDLLERHISDETIPIAERLAVALPWMDRGFVKPPTTAAVMIDAPSQPQLDWSRIPLAVRLQMLDAIQEAHALPTGATPVGSSTENE